MVEVPSAGGATSTEVMQAPQEIDPGSISTLDEAEIRVRQIRNKYWFELRRSDRRFANTLARMDVAREAYGLMGRADLTPEQISHAQFFLIEARDRVMQSYERDFGEAPDIWANELSSRIKAYREAQQPVRISQ